MTLCLAVSLPGRAALIAADQRASVTVEEESRTVVAARDVGGKLLRVGDRWVAFSFGSRLEDNRSTGEAFKQMLSAFEALGDEALPVTVDTLVARAGSAVRGQKHGIIDLVTMDRSGMASIQFPTDLDVPQVTERTHRQGGVQPIGRIDEPVRTVLNAAMDLIGNARSGWDLVRWTASVFRTAASLVPTISPTVDIAWGDVCLTGEADTLVRATDTALLAALRPPTNGMRPSAVLARGVGSLLKHPDTFFLAAPKANTLGSV